MSIATAKPGGTSAAEPGEGREGHSLLGRVLWYRTLDRYPDTAPRFFYLAVVVLGCIILYYEFYIPAAVTPSIIAHFGMTFPFFVYLVVVGNFIGAIASLVAGLADRWGRANLVVYGLLVTGLLILFGLPNAPNLWVYAILYAMLGFVEGVLLVATPALVRDFSPQLGRASAMGFWTMGPVVGSLVVAQVSSRTLPHLTAWQDQFIICGIVGLVVFAIALVGLRELSPRLRDQLMVSIRDRALIEARAAGIDIEASLQHPWRSMFKLDIAGSALGFGLFLVIYYTMIAFFTTYMATVFRYSLSRANGLGNWIWAVNAVALIVVGVASDRLRVRKPFIVVGAVGAIVMTVVFALHADRPATGYYTWVWILSLLAVFLAIVIAPWLAGFTETAEKRNPALLATALAIWGWSLRLVVAASLFVIPYVVTSQTPALTYGPQAEAIQARYPQQVQTLATVDPATLQKLAANPADAAALSTAVSEITTKLGGTPAQAVQRLLALRQVPPQDIAFLQAHGTQVTDAAKSLPNEWRTWWFICAGTEAVLIPLVFLLTGRWSPKRARRDEEEHEREVEKELAALAASRPASTTPA